MILYDFMKVAADAGSENQTGKYRNVFFLIKIIKKILLFIIVLFKN